MLSKSIRKISIGSDVNNQLHISKGSIIMDTVVDTVKEVNPGHYEVWIKRDQDIRLWKTIIGMPVVVEYDTRLD